MNLDIPKTYKDLQRTLSCCDPNDVVKHICNFLGDKGNILTLEEFSKLIKELCNRKCFNNGGSFYIETNILGGQKEEVITMSKNHLIAFCDKNDISYLFVSFMDNPNTIIELEEFCNLAESLHPLDASIKNNSLILLEDFFGDRINEDDYQAVKKHLNELPEATKKPKSSIESFTASLLKQLYKFNPFNCCQ